MLRFLAIAVLGTLTFGCGDEPTDAALTVATLSPIRGQVKVGANAAAPTVRVAAGETVDVGAAGLARVVTDAGSRLLIGASSRVQIADTKAHVESGRVYVEAPARGHLEVETSTGVVRAIDAALSIEYVAAGVRVYVVRGEATWTTEQDRGTVRSGQLLTLADGQASVVPAVLWDDWTGGLAKAGAGSEPVRGVGVLSARVPEEIGRARWPLVSRRLDVRVRIDQGLAITEVDQLFFNPASESVEGLYRIRVPQGAVLQRFAVDRDGRLVDGYVREKAQARQAYEEQVYRGSTLDPALLEWDAPGAYRARIYPIAPGETRRVLIRYAQWLTRPARDAPRLYRYPMGNMAGDLHIQEFSLAVDLSAAGTSVVRAGLGAKVEGQVVQIRRSDFAPTSDFWLELFDGEPSETQYAWRAGHTSPVRAARSRPILNEADEGDYWFLPLELSTDLLDGREVDPGLDLVIVADVSAGTDRSRLELGRSVVESLVAHLGTEDRLALVTSDLEIRGVAGEPALQPAQAQRVDALLESLARSSRGGATDLGATISAAAALLDPARNGAIVYVGDGAPTVGELAARELLARLGRLPRAPRLYAVGVGSTANLELLGAITRGGGIALRVEERAAAADSALSILAHAQRPLVERVTVELGPGIDRVFPRGVADMVLGDVLPIVGRVRAEPPDSVLVRGTLLGQDFEKRIAVKTGESPDDADLRLRWAAERLDQLMLDGATREEVAELGLRYGLITPFTSFYVPSAAELAHAPQEERPVLAIGAPTTGWKLAGLGTSHGALGLLSAVALSACTSGAKEAAPTTRNEVQPQGQADDGTSAAEEGQQQSAPAAQVPGKPQESDPPPPPAPMEPEPESVVEEERTQEQARQPRRSRARRRPTATMGTPPADESNANADHWAEPTDTEVLNDRDGALGALVGGEAGATGGFAGYGGLNLRGSGRGGGGLGAQDTIGFGDAAARESDRSARTSRAEASDDLRRSVTVTTTLSWSEAAHRPRRCSDAAALVLGDKRALWSERLDTGSGAAGWVEVYRGAVRQCEARTWRERRALLRLILKKAGSVQSMLRVYQRLGSTGGAWLRSAILRRVRSPSDLRAVRSAFGLSRQLSAEMIEQVLERAASEPAKVRALRALTAQFPNHFGLKIRLLTALERSGRLPEARRLAHTLRADPLCDATVRTAIGEMYVRADDDVEARRVFSEIVEFAPHDELARRRLGDLYRAHGWFEDAYRQYQTLAQIRPDDPSIHLLLAQAAAGSGRVDEALRFEQRLAETADPGGAQGVARTAILWSSVRFAKLRQAAREREDSDGLAALTARMRRSGVLREAGDLRVSLTWSHPDAQLSLWAARPGQSLARPGDVAPQHGIEVFDVKEAADGEYRFEVRRMAPTDSARHLGAITAELVIVWNEGTPEERARVVPLRFEGERSAMGWTLDGVTLAEAALSRAARWVTP